MTKLKFGSPEWRAKYMKKGSKAKVKAKKKAVENPEYGDHSALERAAVRKAEAFFGDGPKTKAKVLRGYEAPGAAVEVGDLVAVEYESSKFDGERRIYRHDVTTKHRLFISVDGATLIVWPPLRLTKRGIEG